MKFLVQASWEDCPHLSREAKDELWASLPPYQREARSKGIPVLGAGAIYPVSESDIVVSDFAVPAHWPRGYGMDVGWKRTAVVWMAHDRETDCLYLYGEHYRGEAEAVVHAAAVKARGEWIGGAIDPSARGRSQVDGRALLQMYRDLGLQLVEADNAVEAGIYQLLMRMTTGRLKVFKSLTNWINEFRLYRRDERGRIVKENDHALDATRYGHSKLMDISRVAPAPPKPERRYVSVSPSSGTGWMK